MVSSSQTQRRCAPGLQWMEGGKISRLHSVDGTRGYEGTKKEKKERNEGVVEPSLGLLSSPFLSGCACGFDFSCTEQILSSVLRTVGASRLRLALMSERRVAQRKAVWSTNGRRPPRMLFSAPRPRNYEGPRARARAAREIGPRLPFRGQEKIDPVRYPSYIKRAGKARVNWS